MKIPIPKKEFFRSKQFLIISSIIFVSSLAIAGGTVIFYAGEINGEVTIVGSQPQTYNVLIDGEATPVIISDILSQMSDSTTEVQHNIKNNENFAITITFDLISVDSGLTVNMYDGTLTPTTEINVPANDNKWLILKYNTDSSVTIGDTLYSNIDVTVEPT